MGALDVDLFLGVDCGDCLVHHECMVPTYIGAPIGTSPNIENEVDKTGIVIFCIDRIDGVDGEAVYVTVIQRRTPGVVVD